MVSWLKVRAPQMRMPRPGKLRRQLTWSLFNRDGNAAAKAPIAERYAYPMFMLHRGDLHAMLVEAVQKLKPGAIHLRHRAVSFAERGLL